MSALNNLNGYLNNSNRNINMNEYRQVNNYSSSNNIYADHNLHVDDIAERHLIVSSSDRNLVTEEPSNYEIYYDGEIFKNVHSLSLVGARIPATDYVINTGNNMIHFQETSTHVSNNTYLTATLNVGNYDITSLLAEVKSKMDAISGGSSYTITNNTLTSKITIVTDDGVSTGVFNIIVNDPLDPTEFIKSKQRNKYIDNTVGKVLGFKPITKTGSLTYISDYIYDLIPRRYINLFLTVSTDNTNGRVESANDNITRSFANIPLKQNTSTTTDLCGKETFIDNIGFTQSFNQAVKITKIHVEFKTDDGKYYDFHGINNTLIFDVNTLYHNNLLLTQKQLIMKNNKSK
jgi:hypothetical protein